MQSMLSDIVEFIRKKGFNYYSVTEILDGVSNTVEINPAPYCTDVYSVSKFVTMIGIGLLFDEGKLTPDDKIVDIIGDVPEIREKKWLDVTVGNCLNHKTGLINGNLDIDSSSYDEDTIDWLSYIFAMPIEGERGVDYHYTDAAYYLLSRGITALTGENAFDFVFRRVLAPLRFKECAASVCPKGYFLGGSGVMANDKDLAKLGLLWMNGGVFDGKRYISQKWVDLTMENSYGVDERKEYPGFYYKTGANSQILCFISPEKRVLMLRGYCPADCRTELIDAFFKKEI